MGASGGKWGQVGQAGQWRKRGKREEPTILRRFASRASGARRKIHLLP